MKSRFPQWAITACASVAFQLASLAVASNVSAAPTDAEDRQAAQILFDEATNLVDAGSYAAACPKFEEAARLYPEGVGVRESLADCYAKARKFASAEATYDRAASLLASKDPERAQKNLARKAEISPRVSRVTLTVAADAAAIPGLVVTRDGAEVRPALFNHALPVDGGRMVIRAVAPGYSPFEKTIDIPDERGAATVVVVLSKRDNPGDGSEPRPPNGQTNPGQPDSPSSGPSGLLVAGIVTGSVGIVGLVAGLGVGLTGLMDANAAIDAYAVARDPPSAGRSPALAVPRSPRGSS
jgi:hypothetical protein